MEPTPAEVARTLAAGHLPARIRTSGEPAGGSPVPEFAVTHVTDRMGRVLLLLAEDSPVDRALRPVAADGDAVAQLTVADRQPVAGSPWRGRITMSGWATRLAGIAAHRAAMDFAEVNPIGELLDIGRGSVLYRLDLAEIEWVTPGYDAEDTGPDGLRRTDVDVDAFLDAEPDPFAPEEQKLLHDLADHHEDLLAELCAQARETAVPGASNARALRLDRYGLTLGVEVAGEERWIRAGFRHPIGDLKELAEVFHLLACCRCRPESHQHSPETHAH
ncbi:DUF2470 domain-containing protein [Cryptosporangium arvum]|uniref:DUF2470 domain-containing protein n=1 Tax=Cryptosporangium arvum DSM 44712 TaxID=927661 RepID=A0A011ABZ6_9ACTN|nr:DUF2470 domain-containing protein [Cryptosporangium arvum]EXG79556.1 hypothetical protein CryarDRAFT_0597 [Cryptosporangium arvum DSM 44712]